MPELKGRFDNAGVGAKMARGWGGRWSFEWVARLHKEDGFSVMV